MTDLNSDTAFKEEIQRNLDELKLIHIEPYENENDSAETLRNKNLLLKALTKTLGIITPACRKANVGRTTYRNYMKNDMEFARRVSEIQDLQIDLVESAMLSKILTDKNPYLIRFYLSCRARNRGYIERHEQVVIPGAPEDEAGIKALLEKLATDEDLIELGKKEKALDPAKKIEHKPDS